VPGIVSGYARAAELAVAAGFDGVEIHGANGYLPHQFLAANSNRRFDKYGGTVANRARFLLEVMEAVAIAIGSDRTAVRISPAHAYNDIDEPDARTVYAYVAHRLSGMELAYLHVLDCKPGFDVPALIRANYRGTLMLNQDYDRDSANAAIGAGSADLVSFGKLFIANPDLPERFRASAPLNVPDPSSFYGGDARGYTDYPAMPHLARAA
jgi:N-ethylmaleimide reductase